MNKVDRRPMKQYRVTNPGGSVVVSAHDRSEARAQIKQWTGCRTTAGMTVEEIRK